MITVHGQALSGNCWKAAQILRSTERAFRRAEPLPRNEPMRLARAL